MMPLEGEAKSPCGRTSPNSPITSPEITPTSSPRLQQASPAWSNRKVSPIAFHEPSAPPLLVESWPQSELLKQCPPPPQPKPSKPRPGHSSQSSKGVSLSHAARPGPAGVEAQAYGEAWREAFGDMAMSDVAPRGDFEKTPEGFVTRAAGLTLVYAPHPDAEVRRALQKQREAHAEAVRHRKRFAFTPDIAAAAVASLGGALPAAATPTTTVPMAA